MSESGHRELPSPVGSFTPQGVLEMPQGFHLCTNE